MRTLASALLLVLTSLVVCYGVEQDTFEPDTVYWESSQLVEAKRLAEEGDKQLEPILGRLRENAEMALDRGPYSVTFKDDVPPSGDKHDYLSFSRYWWPNPDTQDGLPYVRRDGETNRELVERGDRTPIGLLFEDFESLALAHYFFDEEKYGEHGAKLIHTWFLDPETRMNPHLNFGQGVPGRSEGRGVGVIDTRGFIKLLDGVALLTSGGAINASEEHQLKQWFAEYLQWLRTSELAMEEASSENNHGSWYAAQTSRIALFVDETDLAREIVKQVQNERIPRQFLPDGRQPEEIVRTKSLHYCCFNLEALSIVARVGEQVGVDLWNSRSQDHSLQPGLRYLLPFLLEEKEWTYPQLDDYLLSRGTINVLRMASVRYSDPNYLRATTRLTEKHPDYDYAALLFRAADGNKSDGPHPHARVTISKNSPPVTVDYQLPDISGYSVAEIISQAPSTWTGTAEIGPTDGEPVLRETFRKDRRKEFQEKQGSKTTRAIKLKGGPISLQEVARQLNDDTILAIDQGVATLRLPILVQPDATLVVHGQEATELRLSTDNGAFIANAGTLYILNAKITSWDEQESGPSEFQSKDTFRPFISSYIRSRTFLAGSSFHHLGYHAPTSYGLSLSSQPERDDPNKLHDWPTGIIVGNEFHGLYYGFYSYEARHVRIIDNKYVDCILYGIDPHDRSTELVIAENTAAGTHEKHGIIGSRGINNSYIFRNTTYGNAGTGIMLDRQCSSNVICENKVFNNGQGIAIYESSGNLIAENLIVQNKKSGIRIRNSADINVIKNEVVANGDYGLEISAKRLDDHAKRVERGDYYDQTVSASFSENIVAGNREGVIKGKNVSYLSLSRIDQYPNLVKIEAATGLSDITLRTEEDDLFGGELRDYSGQLERVFDASKPLVEYRSSGRQ